MFFKYIFDALGTAAGDAWPSYGLVTAPGMLSLMAGSLGAIILGGIACSFFLLIFTYFFIIAYKEASEAKCDLKQNLIHIFDENGLSSRHSKSFLHRALICHIQKHFENFYKNYETLSQKEKEAELENIIPSFIKSHACIKNISAPSHHFRLINRTFGGTFGAITGCGCGAVSVLTHMSIIGGFVAIPWLAPAIFGAGFVLSCLMAGYILLRNKEKHAKQQMALHFAVLPQLINAFPSAALNNVRRFPAAAPRPRSSFSTEPLYSRARLRSEDSSLCSYSRSFSR